MDEQAPVSPSSVKLEFTEKYDLTHAQHYYVKHRQGLDRRLSARRETRMLQMDELSPVNPSSVKLEFTEKYDLTHAQHYYDKHRQGLDRRLSTWREARMLQKALHIAGDPLTVLDLPAGTGRFWPALAANPARRILAADSSDAMLKVGLINRPAAVIQRVRPFKCSLFDIPLPDQAVDAVVCIRFLHHVGDPADRAVALKELARVARRNVCLSLWCTGNYEAWRRQRKEARRPPEKFRNRFIFDPNMIEAEFRQAGLEPIARIDKFRYTSMWRLYVLQKIADTAG